MMEILRYLDLINLLYGCLQDNLKEPSNNILFENEKSGVHKISYFAFVWITIFNTVMIMSKMEKEELVISPENQEKQPRDCQGCVYLS